MRKLTLLAVATACAVIIGLALPLGRTQAVDQYWTGQYYQNRFLSGQPAATRQDFPITFIFGYGGPPIAGWTQVDNFSIRWTRRDYFNAAVYSFAVITDDGVRYYVDGVRIIDRWFDQESPTWYVVDRQMTAGEHTIMVEYYEHEGWARIQAGYNQRNPTTNTPVPTATRTGTPGPTPTPAPTATPRPTRTPSIAGTAGVQPTAIQQPPPLVEPGGGVVSGGEPQAGSELIFDETSDKLFMWEGFPGMVSRAGGNDGSHYYIKNHAGRPTFWARWYVTPPESGYYDIYLYIPASDRATHSAVYQVYHSGQFSPEVVINQSASPNGWVILGNFYLAAGEADQYIAVDNQTSEDTATSDLLLDAVMLIFRP